MCRKVEVLFLVIVVEVYCVLVELAAAGPCEYLTHLSRSCNQRQDNSPEERIHRLEQYLHIFGLWQPHTSFDILGKLHSTP